MKNKREEELKQKEFENDILQELRNQELNREFQEKMDQNYHPLALVAIRFFGNLMIGYVIYLIFDWFFRPMMGFIPSELMNGIYTILHVLIWGFAIIGVITKKSPWERFLR